MLQYQMILKFQWLNICKGSFLLTPAQHRSTVLLRIQLDTNFHSCYQEKNSLQCFSLIIKCFYLDATHATFTHVQTGQSKSCDQRGQTSVIMLCVWKTKNWSTCEALMITTSPNPFC